MTSPQGTTSGRATVYPIGVVVVCLAAAGFAMTQAEMLHAASHALQTGESQYAALGIGLSILAIVNRGMLSQSAHRMAGVATTSPAMVRTATVAYAANKVIKAGGSAGLAIYVQDGRRRATAPATSGAITAACLLAAIASFAALVLLVAAAALTLTIQGRLEGWWVVATTTFATYAVVVSALGAVALRSERHAHRLLDFFSRRSRFIAKRTTNAAALAADLAGAMKLAKQSWRSSGRLLAHALVSKILGGVMLLVACHAVGLHLGTGDGLIIYCAALLTSSISIMPGGVGAVEASVGSLLIGAGLDPASAVAAVALFRSFDLILPVAAGLVLGRSVIQRRRPVATTT